MRFCMLTTFYPPHDFGGDATFVQALARALAARGHEIVVAHCVDAFRLRRRDPPPPPVAEPGIEVHAIRHPLGPLSPLLTQQLGHPGLKSRRLKALLARPFDVIHLHNISLIGGPALLPMGRARLRLWTLHEHWWLCPTHIFWQDRKRACQTRHCFRCTLRSGIPPQIWRAMRWPHRMASAVDRVLAPSRYTARRHVEEGGIEPGRIEVLPHFSRLDPGPPARDGGKSPPYFLYVGRLEPPKGILELAEAFAGRPDLPLLIAGTGSLETRLQAVCARAPNIRLVGRLPAAELEDRYRRAVALVFPSLAPETFGLTIAEAMAAGTPAIARSAGGAAELIEPGRTGFVCRTDGEFLAAADRLIDDPGRRREMGRAARQRFEANYTETRHLDRYLDLIGRLATDEPRAA